LQWLAVIAALAGIVLIFDPLHIKADGFSMVLAILSGIFWAISAIISKKLHKRLPHLDLLNITAWPMLLGSIPLVVYALVIDAPPIQWTNVFIASLLFNVILSGVVAWLLWLYALQRLNAGIASMASMLAPVIGVIAAWLQLNEVPSGQELIGMGLIGLALVIISAISIRRHAQIEPAQGQE
jgi:drug/metabolite transporter (DMT)-like permease